MARLELVSTISLRYLCSFLRIGTFKKILVKDRVINDIRGLADTTKVTYSQVCAVKHCEVDVDD
ncbi:hypothetical protein EU527_09030 [Candidatus Thorarchaeota archaeon]|nr:MAG: hypothetical protein EU527_09030 [Candidatus Thorarchaeota archaeon]